MAEILFTVDHATGKTTMKITGTKGRKKCGAIHDAVARDLRSLGAEITESRDTPEAFECETVNETARVNIRS